MWRHSYQNSVPSANYIHNVVYAPKKNVVFVVLLTCFLIGATICINIIHRYSDPTQSASVVPLDPVTNTTKHYIENRRRFGLITSNRFTQYVFTQLPDPEQEFPKSFDWTNYHGYDLTTPNANQHQPNQYCGACWAFGAAHVIDDRMNTMATGVKRFTGTTWLTSIQYILDCGPSYEDGCNGGNTNDAFRFIMENGVSDVTCHNYEAKSQKCTGMSMCQDCETISGMEISGESSICTAREKGTFPVVTVSEYGVIMPIGALSQQWAIDDMVKRMKAELTRGPIACAIMCDPVEQYFPIFPKNPRKKPYEPFIWTKEKANVSCEYDHWAKCTDHVISVVGWGMENETEFWLIRNSWGNYWGEYGYFRIETSKNVMGIESGCDWAIPQALTTQDEIMTFFKEGENEKRKKRSEKHDVPKFMLGE